jgi:hypothetical protein
MTVKRGANMMQKKTAALALALTLGLSGTALAAPAADALAAEKPVEMDISARIAAIEAQQKELTAQLEALKAENSKLKAEKADTDKKVDAVKELQERVKLYGFVRASWDKDTARNQGNAWDNEKTNSRYYLNLMADLKVNDQWTGHFQSETNQRFAHSTAQGADRKLDKQDGTIQRVWISGNLKNGLQVNAGRRWTPLGMQFSLLGCSTSGVDVSYPITKQGLRLGAFYYAMAEYDNADFALWGPTISGPLGHNFDINLAYAKLNIGRNAQVNNFWTAGKQANPFGNRAFVVSAATNVAKNLRLTADYVQTNHEAAAGQNDDNRAYLARLDYKWTNPSVPHSFSAYLRYHDIQAHGNVWADDAWGSILKDSRGWTIGFKYVPWKNIEWETLYQRSNCNMSNPGNTFRRNLIRTQLDYHF